MKENTLNNEGKEGQKKREKEQMTLKNEETK